MGTEHSEPQRESDIHGEMIVAFVVVGGAIATAAWLARLEKRVSERRETCQHLLKDFKSARQWNAG